MKTIGICSDHAGFELKQYIKGWLETKDGNTKTSAPIQRRAATMQILLIPWHWPLKPESVTRVLLSAEVVKVSAWHWTNIRVFVLHFAGLRKLLIWLASIMMPTYSSCRDVLSAQKKLIWLWENSSAHNLRVDAIRSVLIKYRWDNHPNLKLHLQVRELVLAVV